MNKQQWQGFNGTLWTQEINVRDFIQNNYTSYDGDENFLEGPTAATDTLWGMLQALQKEERAKGGVLDMETKVVSSLTSYGAAYIGENTKELEQIVGLQTDKPLKRAFMPYGGIKMAEHGGEGDCVRLRNADVESPLGKLLRHKIHGAAGRHGRCYSYDLLILLCHLH